jgi:hypothetical protein
MNPLRASLASVVLMVAVVSSSATVAAAKAKVDAASTVVVYGKAEASLRVSVATAVEDALREAGWELSDPFSDKEVDTIARCFAVDKPGLCIAATAHAKGVSRIVAVQVDTERGKGSTASLRLSGQLAIVGKPEVVLQLRFCSPCAGEALTSAAQELVKLLLEGSAVRDATTKIELRTSPSGAVVTLDGSLIGGSGREIATVAGPHTLSFELDGYTRQTRTVEALEGKTVVVEVELVPSAGLIVAPDPEGPVSKVDGPEASLRWPKRLAIGGGVLVVGGIVAVLLDEDPKKDATIKQPATILDTARLGVGMIVVGAISGGLGGYLWWKAPSRKPSRSPQGRISSAALVPTSHGALVGVAGTF